MIKKQDGFSLVELMITMVIFVLAIAAASNIFTGLLTQFKQQSKIAETNIEGVIGLEMLRRDIELAGHGLPWDLDGMVYAEAAAAPANNYNDAPGDPPRPFVTGNDLVGAFNTSDELVIKATNVAVNAPAQNWAYSANIGPTAADYIIQVWRDVAGDLIARENLEDNDRVIVLRPAVGTNQRVLVNGGGNFFTDFDAADPNAPFIPVAFQPTVGSYDVYLIYGVDPDTDPRMPFNRADYYIVAGTAPARCAPGTGVLVKSIIEQATGNRGGGLPLLDCVADMQVVFGLDTDDDGTIDINRDDLTTVPLLTVQDIRDQLKEVRVYILAHEGQRDPNFTFTNFTGANPNEIRVGFPRFPAALLGGRDFDLADAAFGITNYENYRWKIYSMVLKPSNLE